MATVAYDPLRPSSGLFAPESTVKAIRVIIVALVVLASSLSAIGDDKPPGNKLVVASDGRLPIILSAPHGGEAAIPGVPERKGEGLAHGPGAFVTGRDVGTEQLAISIAEAIEKRMGKRPF